MSETVVVTDESVTVVSVGIQGPPGAGAQAAGNVLAVSVDGSDLTGARERLDKPYLTPAGASAAALSGDTIIVYPGTYSVTTNLGGSVALWLLLPGATMTAGIGGTLPQHTALVDLNSIRLGVVTAGKSPSLVNVGQIVGKQGFAPPAPAGGGTPGLADLVIQAGENDAGITSGGVWIVGGDADLAAGGYVRLQGGRHDGTPDGSYTCGTLYLGSEEELGRIMVGTLPTADPHVVGQLWNSTGTLKVSAG